MVVGAPMEGIKGGMMREVELLDIVVPWSVGISEIGSVSSADE